VDDELRGGRGDPKNRWRTTQGKEFAIETAIREALANAIRYGCKGTRAAR